MLIGTLPAQKKNQPRLAQKPRTETSKEVRKQVNKAKESFASVDSIRKSEWKKTENEVKYKVIHHKLAQLKAATEMVDTCMLDEVITEGNEKRVFTYSKEGKRETVTHYVWEGNSWRQNMKIRYHYLYNAEGRCTLRSIYYSYTESGSDEREEQRLEISYSNGNRYTKYYENHGGEGKTLALTREFGIDSSGRDILFKDYYWDGEKTVLSHWQENRYNDKGEEIYSLYWHGSGGVQTETIVTGQTMKMERYEWDPNVTAWILMSREIITTDSRDNVIEREEMYYDLDGTLGYHLKMWDEYNAANRLTSSVRYFYDAEGEIESGDRDTYTYDQYNRISTELYELYEYGKYIGREKSDYTYWGTEATFEEDEFEGPILTYNSYDGRGTGWVLIENLVVTRDASGNPVKIDGESEDEITINGFYITVKLIATGTFDSRGNMAATETQVFDEYGIFIRKEKEAYTYDSENRQTNWKLWYEKNATWDLIEEDNNSYDALGREILSDNRYKSDNGVWSGSRRVTVFEGNLEKVTYYEVNDLTGEFRNNPSAFSSNGTLEDGTMLDLHQQYDGSGRIISGEKREWKHDDTIEATANWRWNAETQAWVGEYKFFRKILNFVIKVPEPESYNDGLEGESYWAVADYSEYYYWLDDDWAIQTIRGYIQEPNGDILEILQEREEYLEKTLYSFNPEGKLIRMVRNDEIVIDYAYNADGMLESINENGIITIYKYSTHQYTGLEDVTNASTLTVDGRTVTAGNPEAMLKVYSINGNIIASGLGTVTLPAAGFYVVTMDSIIQKIAVR